MLHNFFVIAVSIILELSTSSPVYNLQAAYITANIGSTGRNIRNLPCISRRTNQSGVCMFAIDCLKSNGTHLGTCIDRFYFGSCCHVSPIAEISENSIDSSIIPNREPPNRINNIITNTNKADPVTIKTTSQKPTMTSISTSVKPSLTTLKQPINYDINSINENSNNTTNNSNLSITSLAQNKTSNNSSSINNSNNINNIGNIQITQTTSGSTSTFFETTTYMFDTTSQDNVKFSTFQIVENNHKPSTLASTIPPISTTTIEAILKPVSTITPSQVSNPKPVINNTRPHLNKTPIIFTSVLPHRSTTTPLLATETPPTSNPLKIKPIKTTNMPIKITTKPYKINKTTLKPVTVSTSKISTIFTKTPLTTIPEVVTSSSTLINTVNNIITTINVPRTTPSTITRIPPSNKLETTKIPSLNPTAFIGTSISETTQLPNDINVNEVVNKTSAVETINGNPATNEIEYSELPNKLGTVIPQPPPLSMNLTEATTKPGLVTWQPDIGETAPSENVSGSDPNTWQPVTTPDGWVLLPSISTITESMSSSTTSSTEAVKIPDTTISPNLDTSTTKTTADSTNVTMTTTVMDAEEYVLSTVQQIITNATSPPNIDTIGTSTEPANGSGGAVNVTQSAINMSKPVNMSDFTDVCGRRMHPEARIVGGEKSTFGRWPWQISLRQWRTSTYLHKCGAALLNENWAITAAHCVDNVAPDDLLLRLGEHDLSTESEPYLHQERRVQIVASHPQFDPRTFEYDLALLRFYEPVTFQPNILPVCVPQTDETFVGRTAHVTGWGRLYEDGPLPSILQEVSVPVINNTVCESMYRAAGYIEHIPYIFICAGWRRGGFDSCEGDSGGPMVIQREDKRFLLAGVISWGIGCAEPNQPGVYTRISEFRDWINQILQF